MAARVAWIVVALQLAATVSRGDPAEDAALAHLDRGVAAFRAGDFAAAHVELAEAQRLAPDRPNPYRWLAMTEAALGDCRSALISVERFLSHVAVDDPRVAEVVAVRGRCISTGALRIESTPSGAAIRIDDGPPIATTPTANLALPVGVHRLTIEKQGYLAQAEPLEVRAMAVTRARYTLLVDRGDGRGDRRGDRPGDRPIYQRWWFWAAVGAVAITTAGVSYAVTRDGDARLPPVTCGSAGCRP
jgi:hypothetical protein